MKLSSVGEWDLIQRISQFLDIGDDAAVIRCGRKFLVLSTDMIYEKTHILPSMSCQDIGRFIVNINASDIAAMGAKPTVFLMACGLPEETEIEYFEELVKAASDECKKKNMTYTGGDTKKTDRLTITGFCMGETKKPVPRSGAKIGDVVAVTGTVGTAALGIYALLNNLKSPHLKEITEKAVKPQARIKEGITIGKYAHAMTDLSDSLAVGLYDIAEKSRVGVEINLDMIPIHPNAKRFAVEEGLNVMDYALYGGGDYELLYTIDRSLFQKVKNKTNSTEIGVVSGKDIILNTQGSKKKLEKKGFQHFTQNKDI